MRFASEQSATFSIIVPTFNREALLVEALESISKQTYPHWECIVVDDGSTDRSKGIVKHMSRKDSRFYYLSQRNSGVAAARNRGARRSAYNWLIFLDSDDLLVPDALRNYSYLAGRAASSRLQPRILSGMLKCDIVPNVDASVGIGTAIQNAFYSTFGSNPHGLSLSIQNCAFERTLVAELGGFNELYRTGEDREFLIRGAALSEVIFTSDTVAIYRKQHGLGKSDLALSTGEKVRTAADIYSSLRANSTLHTRQRLKREPIENVERWCDAMITLCKGIERIHTNGIDEAIHLIHQAFVQCSNKAEEIALSNKLIYFTYYPAHDPHLAGPRCAEWLNSIANALPLPDTASLPALLRRAAFNISSGL